MQLDGSVLKRVINGVFVTTRHVESSNPVPRIDRAQKELPHWHLGETKTDAHPLRR